MPETGATLNLARRERWTIPSLQRFLRRDLARTLPQTAAQARMAPRPRTGWRPGVLPEGCRDAGALLLLYPKDGDVHILLTVRTDHLPCHQGQVSLPGGGVDPAESVVAAALRELQEEVGVNPRNVDVLGLLSPLHIPVSGFILRPVVGVSTRRPEIYPRESEVARILEVPVAVLQDPDRVRTEPRIYKGRTYQVPYFLVEDCKVWGATAMVLAEFLWILGSPPSPK